MTKPMCDIEKDPDVSVLIQMILEMCRGELPADLDTVKSHIQRIQTSHSSKVSML